MSYNFVDKTENSFNAFANFINNITNNPYRNEYCVYDTITNISKSDPNDDNSDALVQSEFKMINFDNLWNSSYGGGRPKPLSVDALYLSKKSILYLIEFKNAPLNLDYKKELSNIIKNNKNISKDDEKTLKKVKETYVNEIIYKLKYKPLESVLLILPKVYEKYRDLHENNIKNLYSFLINDIKIHYLLVYNSSYASDHVKYRGDVKNKLRKINQFEPIINMCELMDEKDFNNFISKF